jgi:hypothetical protein
LLFGRGGAPDAKKQAGLLAIFPKARLPALEYSKAEPVQSALRFSKLLISK